MLRLASTTPAGRPAELLRKVNRDLYAEAYGEGCNLSMYLERLDPSTDHKDTRLDAFGRLVRAAGLVTDSRPELGLRAATLQQFEEKDENTKALVPELIARMYRRAAFSARHRDRAVYLSSDTPSGMILNPFAFSATPRVPQLAPAIPLSELIAFNTGIDSNVYKTFYLQHDATQTRMVRVSEATDIPKVKLTTQEHAIQLFKYGRALQVSYETLRRTPIDLIAFHIQRVQIQAEIDKVAAVLAVIISGDGNSNTAAGTFAKSALDAAGGAVLTLKAWLAFKKKFVNPYILTTALMNEDVALELELLNTGSANQPLVVLPPSTVGSIRPLNQDGNGVAYGWTSDAPARKIVGFDRRVAIERVFEIGASIQEVTRWIENQTQVLTMTETEGYGVIDNGGSKILDLAA